MTGGDYARRDRGSASNSLGSWHTENDAGALDHARGGLEYERRPIGSRTGETQTDEFTRINPSQKIPVLQDGEFTLTESAAIVTYVGRLTVLNVACYRPPIRKPGPTITNGVFF